MASKAFAVADHQIGHIYVSDPVLQPPFARSSTLRRW
jgi:hypothetical protein